MTWVAIGVTVGGLVVGGYAQHEAANKQDKKAAEGIAQQGQMQAKQNASTAQLITKTSKSNADQGKQSLLGQFQDTLENKKALSTSGLNQVGAVSTGYTKAANDAASGIADYGNNTAGLLSAIDAPGVQRQSEAADLSRFGSGLAATRQESAADQFINQMQVSQIKANPYLVGIGQAMQSYGKAKAGSMGGGDSGSALGTLDGAGPAAGAAAPGFSDAGSGLGAGLYGFQPVYGGGFAG